MPAMSFLYPTAAFQPHPVYNSSPRMSYFDRLAAEHERRAQAALAMAQQERRRQVALQRQRELEAYYRDALYSPEPELVYYRRKAPFIERIEAEQRRRQEQVQKMKAWLSRRRQEEALRQAISFLVHPASQSPAPKVAQRPAQDSENDDDIDFVSSLWNSLSPNRSDEEKERIIRELDFSGQPLKRNTTTPSRPPRPAQPALRSSPLPSSSPYTLIETVQRRFDALKSTSSATEGALEDLLLALDRIESSGSESIRGARKALVGAVEAALDEVQAERRRKEKGKGKEVETSPLPVYIPVVDASDEVVVDAAVNGSSDPAPTADEVPLASAPVVDSTVPDFVVVDDASTDGPASSSRRSLSPASVGSPRPKRPSSVVIEEVPDEGN